MRLSITAATFLFCSCAQGFAPSLSSSRQSNAVVQNAVISSQWTMDEPVPEVSFMFLFFFDHSTCHDKKDSNRQNNNDDNNNLIRTSQNKENKLS